ncbi:sigma-54-dependent Fis family transcriptional regulator [Pseudonocardia sp. GCM10023141]|uniref:sigma-54-dependent Fis family transcriptional regulator n=1 Tax=Pseudonocardia sp. GCM10023141 TaxID=3252653 RepID=UPI00361D939D
MSTTDAHRLRDAREDYLASGHIAARYRPLIRPEIAASWSRSRTAGVSPLEVHLPALPEFDEHSALRAAAAPVLTRMAEELESLGCALSLADGEGRLVHSWIPDAMVRTSLRRIMADPGASCSEALVGTNGVGTALADLKTKIIGGAEHWADLHLDMTCVAAPVLDPISRRPAAVINVTMMEQHVHPALTSLVRWTVAEVRQSLMDSSGKHERRMFEHYLAHRGRTDRPSLLLSPRLVVADPAAARLLPDLDAADLWQRVGGDVGRAARSFDLELPDGVMLPVRVTPIGEAEGLLVEVCHGAHTPRRRTAGRPARSTAYAAAVDAAAEAVAVGVPLLLVGEPGAGKLTLARRLVPEPVGPAGTAALDARDGRRGWIEGVHAAAAGSDALLIRHLDELDPTVARELACVLDDVAASATGAGPTVIGTARLTTAVEPALLACFALATVEVPPLRDRAADLPGLVADLSARQDRPARWSGEALDALARREWPGNVRELENVVQRTLINSGGLIRVADLPLDVRQNAGRRTLSRIERAERDAIVAALATSRGNKVIAAEELGISRSSLYRKIERYGLADSGQVDMRLRS